MPYRQLCGARRGPVAETGTPPPCGLAAASRHRPLEVLPAPVGARTGSDPRDALPLRVGAEHRHLTAVAAAVAFEDLHRGGLTGPVRAEQGDGLARGDVEVDAVDGRVASIVFAEAAPPHGE